jgi:hypothetical protein
MSERIYIDTCALSRPTDDQLQTRIRAETEAISKVLDAAAENAVDWVASSILFAELSRNPDRQRRRDTLRFLSMASEFVQPPQQPSAAPSNCVLTDTENSTPSTWPSPKKPA